MILKIEYTIFIVTRRVYVEVFNTKRTEQMLAEEPKKVWQILSLGINYIFHEKNCSFLFNSETLLDTRVFLSTKSPCLENVDRYRWYNPKSFTVSKKSIYWQFCIERFWLTVTCVQNKKCRSRSINIINDIIQDLLELLVECDRIMILPCRIIDQGILEKG